MDNRGFVFFLLFLLLGTSFFSNCHGYDALSSRQFDESYDNVGPKNVDIPEDKVTYEGAQIWRVVAQEKTEYLDYLRDKGGTLSLI